jgi:hypothetical protein
MNFDNDKPYDVSRNRLPQGTTSIMDVLTVNAPSALALSPPDKARAETLVLNFLIDKSRVEGTALYEDLHVARDVVYASQRSGARGGVRYAYVMDGHNFSINVSRRALVDNHLSLFFSSAPTPSNTPCIHTVCSCRYPCSTIHPSSISPSLFLISPLISPLGIDGHVKGLQWTSGPPSRA